MMSELELDLSLGILAACSYCLMASTPGMVWAQQCHTASSWNQCFQGSCLLLLSHLKFVHRMSALQELPVKSTNRLFLSAHLIPLIFPFAQHSCLFAAVASEGGETSLTMVNYLATTSCQAMIRAKPGLQHAIHSVWFWFAVQSLTIIFNLFYIKLQLSFINHGLVW